MANPSLTNVDLIVLFDGDNNATTYTPDLGSYALTFGGDTKLQTAVKKFGVSSAYFDGDNDYLLIGDAGDFDYLHAGDQDFTVEIWYQPDKLLTLSGDLLSSRLTLGAGFRVYVIDFDMNVRVSVSDYPDDSLFIAGSVQLTEDTFSYIKATYQASSTTLKLYVDGTLAGTDSSYTGSARVSDILAIGRVPGRPNNPVSGYVDSIRISKEFLDDTDVPTEAFDYSISPEIIASGGSPLGSASVVAVNDFTTAITDTRTFYEMQLTGTPAIVIPISSWQATSQLDRSNYAQCVVPAADQFVGEIAARQGIEEFVIYRVAIEGGQRFDSEIVRAPITTTSVARGPTNYTATISGYQDAPAASGSPITRTLVDIRSITIDSSGKFRVRAAIDWFLRPGDIAVAEENSFTASYINYYTTSEGESYMDVGDR